MRKSQLPTEVATEVDRLAEILAAISRGEDRETEVAQCLYAAVRAAWSAAPMPARDPWATASATVADAVAENVQECRQAAGWTQQRLADAMGELGFTWKRVTVAEAEASARRLSWEELLALAALFGVPVVELLRFKPEWVVEFEATYLEASEVDELLIGRGGKVGEGGPRWSTASRFLARAGLTVTPPSQDLWRNRDRGRR